MRKSIVIFRLSFIYLAHFNNITQKIKYFTFFNLHILELYFILEKFIF